MSDNKFHQALIEMCDRDSYRERLLEKAAAHDAHLKEHAETIIMRDGDAALYFWPEQTPDEVRQVKQLVVHLGLAEWAVKR